MHQGEVQVQNKIWCQYIYIDRVSKIIKKISFIQCFFLLVLCRNKGGGWGGAYTHIASTKGSFCFFRLSFCLYPLYSHCACLPFSSLCLLSCLLSFSLCLSIASTTLPCFPTANGHSGYSYQNQQNHAEKKRQHKQASVADGPAFFTAVRLCLTSSAAHIPLSSFGEKELRFTQDRVLQEVWHTRF